ncbi:MAG: ATP-binding protein, partial [Verrucomicrobia bacterium]|nr:ATP-binding protein [Verrucomicrobiota bacterium]
MSTRARRKRSTLCGRSRVRRAEFRRQARGPDYGGAATPCAIDVINTLSAAQTNGILKTELKRYLAPALLLLDEVGYLPIDQRGADLL